jgi:hypothetical protein
VLTETEDKIIDDILAPLNRHGLTSQQSQNLLNGWGGLLRWGSAWRRGRRTRKKAAYEQIKYKIVAKQKSSRSVPQPASEPVAIDQEQEGQTGNECPPGTA